MPADRSELDVLVEAMRTAAVELAAVIGLEGVEGMADPMVDRDQVPARLWDAADWALKFLLVGLGTADEEPGELDEADVARFLQARAEEAGGAS